MRSRGHRLLLAAPENSEIFRRAAADQFEIYPLSDRKWLYPWIILTFSLWMRREKIQVVNMHSSRDGWIGGLAARLAGVSLVIRSRHIEVDYPNPFWSRIGFGTVPHLVFTTSERIQARLIEELSLDSHRVISLPTGIDELQFSPGNGEVVRSEVGVSPKEWIAGMISVLRSWKGHDDFLDAILRVRGHLPNARFWIVGGGPGETRLQEKIQTMGLEGCVKMLGHRDDVAEVLRAIDLLVLPSTGYEGVPQIILQAQSTGKPVVATRVGGIPEVVQNNATGLLVEPHDSDGLAKAMERLARDPELSRRLGDAGRRQVLSLHTLSGMCRTLEQCYEPYLK